MPSLEHHRRFPPADKSSTAWRPSMFLCQGRCGETHFPAKPFGLALLPSGNFWPRASRSLDFGSLESPLAAIAH